MKIFDDRYYIWRVTALALLIYWAASGGGREHLHAILVHRFPHELILFGSSCVLAWFGTSLVRMESKARKVIGWICFGLCAVLFWQWGVFHWSF